MRKVLLTGMSGTGKSSALLELEKRGFAVVDTDYSGWSEWSDGEGGYVWREDRIRELLAHDDGPTFYVAGTASNQGPFYSHFDAIVLLSAPAEVLLHRIRNPGDKQLRREQRGARSHPGPPARGRAAAPCDLHP